MPGTRRIILRGTVVAMVVFISCKTIEVTRNTKNINEGMHVARPSEPVPLHKSISGIIADNRNHKWKWPISPVSVECIFRWAAKLSSFCAVDKIQIEIEVVRLTVRNSSEQIDKIRIWNESRVGFLFFVLSFNPLMIIASWLDRANGRYSARLFALLSFIVFGVRR